MNEVSTILHQLNGTVYTGVSHCRLVEVQQLTGAHQPGCCGKWGCHSAQLLNSRGRL